MNKSARLRARNRANASRSTGPRSRRGKSAVARNARKHGATGRPPSEDVAKWLAVILDRPDVISGTYMPKTDTEFRALSLAEAEARLVMCQDALDAFEAGDEAPTETVEDMRSLREHLFEVFMECATTKNGAREFLSLLRRIGRVEDQGTAFGGKRHKLLKRYVREARSSRGRAFRAWIEAQSDTVEGARQIPRNAYLPKQSQNST